MTQEQFDRKKNYGVSMAIARTMLNKNLINKKEYRKINLFFKEKYNPIYSGYME